MRSKFFMILIMLVCLASYALAQDVCCEKLATSDDFCVYTDEANCDPTYKSAAVSCEQTSFCKPGCCYGSNDGECYKNVARGECEKNPDATWRESTACDIAQCQKGCCILGTQGFLVTEVKCKQETSDYFNVSMQWDPTITDEFECQQKAKSQDVGCCVSGGTCTFTTRASCEVADQEISENKTGGSEVNGTSESQEEGIKEVKDGFYEGMLCSNDLLNCGCAKQTNTGCYDDKVYWFDSCGNRENIYSSDLARSYNGGYVLDADSICGKVSSPSKTCGNCDYALGTVCRALEEGESMPNYGNHMCKSTACDSTYDDGISPNAGGSKKNGESWCLYDSVVGEGKDLVGSRHFRSLCINGEEMIEACMDYREEICIQGVLGSDPEDTLSAFRVSGDYIEAACRDNRWEDCHKCNEQGTDCGSECDNVEFDFSCDDCEDNQEEEVKAKAKELAHKLCCAKKCCEKESLRDCYFLTSGESREENFKISVKAKAGQIVSVENIGYCVPQVPPGLKFWTDEEGGEPISSSTRSSPATTAATTGDLPHGGTGEGLTTTPSSPVSTSGSTPTPVSTSSTGGVTTGNTPHGGSGGRGPNSNAESVCAQANQECKVVWHIGGTGALGIGGLGTQDAYECVQNCHCTKPEWVISGNNLCKAQGDCGAYYNIVGQATMDGYANTASKEEAGDDNLYFNGYQLKESDLENWNTLMARGDALEVGGGDDGFFGFGSMNSFLSQFGVPLGTFFLSGIYTYAMGGQFLTGVTGGLDVMMSGISKTPLKSMGDKAAEIYGSAGKIAKGTEFNKGYSLDPSTFKQLGNKKELLKNGWKEEGNKFICTNAQGCGEATKDLTTPKSGGGVMGTVNAIMWLYTIYNLIDVFMAEDQERTYTITCSPWVPPEGGANCEVCNEDHPDNPHNKPCSVYRCRSLGATCRLINQGTSKEECVNLHPNDASSPIIEPWEEAMPEEFTITRITEEGNKGFKVNEEIGPYDDVTLAIMTDEPAQCKFIDQIGMEYDQMSTFFGDSLYTYEHKMTFVMPPELTDRETARKIGNTYTLYIRCKDASGNANEKDYFIRFNVADEPDMTPPRIEETSLVNGAYIRSNLSGTDLTIYVNEKATCKYDTTDLDYDNMGNEFRCSTASLTANNVLHGLYECSTTLDFANITDYRWYIRCKDRDDNENHESYEFTLVPTDGLVIVSAGPTGTYYTPEVTLKVATMGGAESGKATCGFSLNEDATWQDLVEFVTTGSSVHEQPLTPGLGEFTYYIRCMDIAGNVAEDNVTFIIDVDTEGPEIVYIYITPSNYLHLEMNEPSDCMYSNSTFVYEEGKEMTGSGTKVHELPIVDSTYHIKCRDEFKNEAYLVVFP